MDKKIVLFGAGNYGQEALLKFGEDRILYFCDNNTSITGNIIHGKRVINVEELIKLDDDFDIVISISKVNRDLVYNQLCGLGLKERILDYSFGVASCKGIYSVVEQAKKVGLVIYGTGFWGELAYRIFELFDLKPICFCSDDVNETRYLGTKVISLKEAVGKYPYAVFISAADDAPIIGLRSKMNNKLKDESVYSEYSDLKLENYTFLLDTGIDVFESINKNGFSPSAKVFRPESLNKIMVFNHMGHSGSYYLENLLDSHSSILTIPFGMGVNNYKEIYLAQLQYLSGKELIIEICSLINSHFKTKLDINKLHINSKVFVSSACRNHLGEFETRVALDPNVFINNMIYELNNQDKPTFSSILKTIYAVYNNALGRKFDSTREYWIFYHMHKPNVDLNTWDNLIDEQDFSRLEYLFIIREPIQHLYSCINFYTKMRDITAAMISSLENLKMFISSDLGYVFEKSRSNHKKNVMVVRFEDLKLKPKETLLAFCKWADIEYTDSMNETTINGIKVYLTTIDELGNKVYITGHDPLAVNRKDFSSQMTSYDILRLNIAFQKFKKAYGYEVDVPDFKDFSKEFLEELYLLDFKFIKTLINNAEKTGDITGSKNLLSSGVRELLLDFMRNYQEGTEYYEYLKIEE